MASHLFEGRNVMKTLKSIIKRCKVYQKNNPKTEMLAKSALQQRESILERTENLILLICQKLTDVLAYKLGCLLLRVGLRLFPVIVNRL